MAEVLGYEAGIPEFLTQPRSRGVAKRVRGDVLLEAGARRRPLDDRGERRLLEPASGEAAEGRLVGAGPALGAESAEFARKAARKWLAAGLSSLAAADEQRGRRRVEVEAAAPSSGSSSHPQDAMRQQRRQARREGLEVL